MEGYPAALKVEALVSKSSYEYINEQKMREFSFLARRELCSRKKKEEEGLSKSHTKSLRRTSKTSITSTSLASEKSSMSNLTGGKTSSPVVKSVSFQEPSSISTVTKQQKKPDVRPRKATTVTSTTVHRCFVDLYQLRSELIMSLSCISQKYSSEPVDLKMKQSKVDKRRIFDDEEAELLREARMAEQLNKRFSHLLYSAHVSVRNVGTKLSSNMKKTFTSLSRLDQVEILRKLSSCYRSLLNLSRLYLNSLSFTGRNQEVLLQYLPQLVSTVSQLEMYNEMVDVERQPPHTSNKDHLFSSDLSKEDAKVELSRMMKTMHVVVERKSSLTPRIKQAHPPAVRVGTTSSRDIALQLLARRHMRTHLPGRGTAQPKLIQTHATLSSKHKKGQAATVKIKRKSPLTTKGRGGKFIRRPDKIKHAYSVTGKKEDIRIRERDISEEHNSHADMSQLGSILEKLTEIQVETELIMEKYDNKTMKIRGEGENAIIRLEEEKRLEVKLVDCDDEANEIHIPDIQLVDDVMKEIVNMEEATQNDTIPLRNTNTSYYSASKTIDLPLIEHSECSYNNTVSVSDKLRAQLLLFGSREEYGSIKKSTLLLNKISEDILIRLVDELALELEEISKDCVEGLCQQEFTSPK